MGGRATALRRALTSHVVAAAFGPLAASALPRKLRLPQGDDWIAKIARNERDDIEAEVSQRLAPKPLGTWHWSRIDTIYFCSAGIMRGYHALETHGYIVDVREITTTGKGPAGETVSIRREPGPFFRPVIETIGRLHRMKSDALKELGLDQSNERDVFATIYSAAQTHQQPQPGTGVETPEDEQRNSGDPVASQGAPMTERATTRQGKET